jgi:isopentenyldiphosphate isomerase
MAFGIIEMKNSDVVVIIVSVIFHITTHKGLAIKLITKHTREKGKLHTSFLMFLLKGLEQLLIEFLYTGKIQKNII